MKSPEGSGSPEREIVRINQINYSFVHKPKDVPIGQDVYAFVINEWVKPLGKSAINLHKALAVRDLDLLRDEKGAIVALCSYSVYETRLIDDGNLEFILVKKGSTRSGIGSFLSRRAVDRIITSVEKRADFVPPVKISVLAETEEGAILAQKMENEYKGRVKFDIAEAYKEIDDEADY